MALYEIHFENNDVTEMADVVSALQYAFGFSHAEAFEAMKRVHNGETEVVALCHQGDIDLFRRRLKTVNETIKAPFAFDFRAVDDSSGRQLVSADNLPELSYTAFSRAELEKTRQDTKHGLVNLTILGIVLALCVYQLIGLLR